MNSREIRLCELWEKSLNFREYRIKRPVTFSCRSNLIQHPDGRSCIKIVYPLSFILCEVLVSSRWLLCLST